LGGERHRQDDDVAERGGLGVGAHHGVQTQRGVLSRSAAAEHDRVAALPARTERRTQAARADDPELHDLYNVLSRATNDTVTACAHIGNTHSISVHIPSV
jgi:hypothetical protein